MIEKIYLDMDGVLCDFDMRFEQVFGIKSKSVPGRMTESVYWESFVTQKQFERLDWDPGGETLLDYIEALDIPYEILSSSATPTHFDEIARQKTLWLGDRGINVPVNIVPGKRFKKTYATPASLLIDDIDKNVFGFIEAGGHSILHRNIEDTIDQLKKLGL